MPAQITETEISPTGPCWFADANVTMSLKRQSALGSASSPLADNPRHTQRSHFNGMLWMSWFISAEINFIYHLGIHPFRNALCSTSMECPGNFQNAWRLDDVKRSTWHQFWDHSVRHHQTSDSIVQQRSYRYIKHTFVGILKGIPFIFSHDELDHGNPYPKPSRERYRLGWSTFGWQQLGQK